MVKNSIDTEFNILAGLIGDALQNIYGGEAGFVLVSYPVNTDKRNWNFIGNVKKEKAADLLREAAERMDLEFRTGIGPIKGNA